MSRPRMRTTPPLLTFLIPSYTRTFNRLCPVQSLSCTNPLTRHAPRNSTLLIPHTQTRHASHASQGRANKVAGGPGKRLGAKKTDSELVVPGNIIFRQRGTHWFPGENCAMGKDHTIFALQKGFVRYYKDPSRNAERKYIGVVFERGMHLPRGPGGVRWRRLGMDVRTISTVSGEDDQLIDGETVIGDRVVEGEATELRDAPREQREAVPEKKEELKMSAGYQYRQTNYEIGRAAERKGVRVRPHDPKDRFLAWRKRTDAKWEKIKKGMGRRK